MNDSKFIGFLGLFSANYFSFYDGVDCHMDKKKSRNQQSEYIFYYDL